MSEEAVKAPAPPSERTTPHPFPAAEPTPRKTEEPDFKPRYVALPRHWERGHGRRNLISGVALFSAAAVLLAWAVYLAGSAAVLTLGSCLATTMLLFVLARSRLFRQRNGGFLGMAAVCLLAVFLVIVHQGWLLVTGAGMPRYTAAGAAPAPAVPSGKSTAHPVESAVPLLRDAFPGTMAIPNSGPAVRIVSDLPVTIDGKQYLAKGGDFYPLLDVTIGQVHFSVGEHEVVVADKAAEIAGDEKTDVADDKGPTQIHNPATPRAPLNAEDGSPAMTEVQSHQEAIRRYPDLGVKGSLQNQAFVSAYKEQKFAGDAEFFKDPNWPVNLAEILAEKDGWKRADRPAQPPATSPSGSPGNGGSRESR